MNSNTNSAVLQSKSIVNDSLRQLRRAKNSSSSFSAPRDSQDISSSNVSSTTDFVKENGSLSLSASEYVKESHEESKEEESENELEIDQEALTEPEQELESESGPETESKPETMPGSSQESKPLVGGNQAEDEEDEGAEKDHSSRRKIIKASKRPSDITIECSRDGMIKKIKKTSPKRPDSRRGFLTGGVPSRKRESSGLSLEGSSDTSASKNKRGKFEVNLSCAGIAKSQLTFISSESEYSDLYNNKIPSRFGFTDSKQGIPSSLFKNFEDCQDYLAGQKCNGYIYLYSTRARKWWKKNTSEWEEGEKVNGVCIPAEIAVRWFQSPNCKPFLKGQMTSMIREWKEHNSRGGTITTIPTRDLIISENQNKDTGVVHCYLLQLNLYKFGTKAKEVGTLTLPKFKDISCFLKQANNDEDWIYKSSADNRIRSLFYDASLARLSRGYRCCGNHILNLIGNDGFQDMLDKANTDLSLTK